MTILGLMSGTSLDGLDLALCTFDTTGYTIFAADTVAYSPEWRQRLQNLHRATAQEYVEADVELGHLYGQIVNSFLERIDFPVDAIASHGHTIFHQPSKHLTAQIGDPSAIAAETGIKVVSGFRNLDVALGGQGAPLVPIGDKILFPQYDACLNLGGIANISFDVDGRCVAYDICPCNMVLNALASRMDMPFDRDGELARRGLKDYYLGQTLNCLDYYRLPAPKSLGKEWVIEQFWPVVQASQLPDVDLLRTVTEHIAQHIATAAHNNHIGTMLVTGGGAHNKYLVELIGKLEPEVEVTVPDALTVNYKEALIFALLGYLRLGGKPNTLATATGARCDSIGGLVSGLPCTDASGNPLPLYF